MFGIGGAGTKNYKTAMSNQKFSKPSKLKVPKPVDDHLWQWCECGKKIERHIYQWMRREYCEECRETQRREHRAKRIAEGTWPFAPNYSPAPR